MIYFRKNLKYNIKKNLLYYKKKVNCLNFLNQAVINLNNKFYKLLIETYYSNLDSRSNFINNISIIVIKSRRLIDNLTIVIKLY